MSDMLGYKGKRVVVSGCFSGMGEATAKILLDLGAEVHGLDFKQSTLPLASFNQIDLRDAASIEAGVAAIGGKVDALFSCAGVADGTPGIERINFIGHRYMIDRMFALDMFPRGSAIIILLTLCTFAVVAAYTFAVRRIGRAGV